MLILLILIQTMREIINDKRYNALKTLGERKQAFNEVRNKSSIAHCICQLKCFHFVCSGFVLGCNSIATQFQFFALMALCSFLILNEFDLYLVLGAKEEAGGWREAYEAEKGSRRIFKDAGSMLSCSYWIINTVL